MKTTQTTTIDPSILPEAARQELHDFYSFLVGKYVIRRPSRRTHHMVTDHSSAAALAASSVVGIWKDRDLGDSSLFARSLREKAQNRNFFPPTI